jgi:aminopeptidase N
MTFKKGAEELLYQLTHDDGIGRMWAASELKSFADRAEVVAALQSAANADSFWAARRSAVETLGSLQREEHLAFFKTKCFDAKSRVRVAALKALGELKQKSLVKFFEERFAREDSYLAQAEAVRAIGKCGDKSSLPFLNRAAQTKSPRNVVRNAAEAARKEIEDKV